MLDFHYVLLISCYYFYLCYHYFFFIYFMFVLFFVCHCHINACMVILYLYYWLPTNLFCSLKSTKKKRGNWNKQVWLLLVLWYESCWCSILVIFLLCIVQARYSSSCFRTYKDMWIKGEALNDFGIKLRISDDGFFDELQWSSNKNLEVRLVVLNVLIVFKMFNATDL